MEPGLESGVTGHGSRPGVGIPSHLIRIVYMSEFDFTLPKQLYLKVMRKIPELDLISNVL